MEKEKEGKAKKVQYAVRLSQSVLETLDQIVRENPRLSKALLIDVAVDYLTRLYLHDDERFFQILGAYWKGGFMDQLRADGELFSDVSNE